jgi:hypothetical protein
MIEDLNGRKSTPKINEKNKWRLNRKNHRQKEEISSIFGLSNAKARQNLNSGHVLIFLYTLKRRILCYNDIPFVFERNVPKGVINLGISSWRSLNFSIRTFGDRNFTSLAKLFVGFRFLTVLKMVISKLKLTSSVLSEKGFGSRILNFKFFSRLSLI